MKKLLIGVGVLLVVLVAAVLIGPSFIDWNQYRDRIAAEARNATGRDLAIDGDISVAILPSPTVSVQKLRFANAEGGSAPDMATLEALEVSVALLPLIQGDIQITEIALVKPVILLETLADGRGNWEFAAPAGQEAAPAPETGGGMPSISLDDVRIEDGTVIYRDAATQSEQRIESLDARLAAASLQGPFSAKGDLVYQGLPANFDVSTGQILPAAPAPVSIALGLGAEGSGGDARIKFTGTLAQAADGVSAKGKLEGGSADLAAALEAVAPGMAAGAPIALNKPFKVDGDIDYAPTGGAIENFAVALGDLAAAGDVRFTPGSPATAAVKLTIARLDLDSLLSQTTAAAPAQDEPGSQGPGGFALPADLDATVDIAVDAIAYRGGLIDDAKLVGELAKGEFALKQLAATLPGGGSFSAAGTLKAVDGAPQIAGAFEGKADNLRALLDWLQVAPADVPSERLRKLALTSRFTASPSLLELADLDLKLDSSRVTGGARIALPADSRQKMAFGVGLAIDQLNVDSYMPPKSQQAEPAADAGAGLPLNSLAPLAGLDANVELRVGKLTVNQQTMQGVHLDGTVTGGTLTLRDLSVKEFAGGKGAIAGTVSDLAGTPRFDTKFDLTAKDAAKVFQAAGMGDRVKGKLGALKLAGALAGGAQDVNFDVDFALSGIGASGKAKGKATGIGAGVPRVDSSFNVQAKEAGPLLALAGVGGEGGKLGALSLKGTAASGQDDLTYDVQVSLSGVGAQGAFNGRILNLSSATPQVDTKLNFSADKPAPLLALAGMAGPAANKLGKLAVSGTMKGGADDMRLDLALQGFGGRATLAGAVQAAAAPTRFDLALTADHPEFRQLLSALVPGYQPAASQLGPLKLAAKAKGSTEKATVSGLSLRAGETTLNGQMSMDQSGGKPYVSAALKGGVVDVSPFMAPGGGGGGGGGERWSREKLDLSALQAMDADVEFTADRFIANENVIDNLRAQLTLRDGTLTIKQLNGNAYGGAIDLTGTLASRGVPTFNGRMTADNVAVNQLAGGGFLANRITGPLSFDADLNSSGYSMAELMEGLQGDGKIDGSITVLSRAEQQIGSALLGILGQQVKQLQGFTDSINAVYSAFTGAPNALTGTFNINRGVLNTQDLSLANERARALASGDADIARWTLDMLANIYSMQHPEQPFMVVDLDGPLDGPNPRFTGNAFARGTDQSQGVFGAQSPEDIFGGLIPGLPGGEGGAAVPGTGEGGLPGIVEGILPGIGGEAAPGTGGEAAPGGVTAEPLPDLGDALPGEAAPGDAAEGEALAEQPAEGAAPGEVAPPADSVTPEIEPAPAEQPAEPEAPAVEAAPQEPESAVPTPPEKPEAPTDFGAAPAVEEPTLEPVPEAQPEPVPEPVPETVIQPEIQAVPEAEPQPEPVPEAQPQPEIAPQPLPETAPILEPVPEETQSQNVKKRKSTETQAVEEAPAEELAPEAQPESGDPGAIVPLILPEPQ
jgi:uncharacterized protein involved in outer membrane biogenesis